MGCGGDVGAIYKDKGTEGNKFVREGTKGAVWLVWVISVWRNQ